MTQRQARLRSFAQRLNLIVPNKNVIVTEFWAKLLKSSTLDCKESLDAMLAAIDQYAAILWGPQYAVLCEAPKTIFLRPNAQFVWPEDRQK
jgi:hypothetical protein